ncbi:MAG: copper-translocating P-type ATPase, partial [Saccharofermentanales bacterium]
MNNHQQMDNHNKHQGHDEHSEHDHDKHNGHDIHEHDAHAGHEHDAHHGEHGGHGGHGEHDHDHSLGHAHHLGNIKRRFIISLILSIPIFLFSSFMGREFFFTIRFIGSDWINLIFATALFFYGGMPFLRGAKMELSEKSPGMMTLISLG